MGQESGGEVPIEEENVEHTPIPGKAEVLLGAEIIQEVVVTLNYADAPEALSEATSGPALSEMDTHILSGGTEILEAGEEITGPLAREQQMGEQQEDTTVNPGEENPGEVSSHTLRGDEVREEDSVETDPEEETRRRETRKKRVQSVTCATPGEEENRIGDLDDSASSPDRPPPAKRVRTNSF